jgi:autotransporter-associated beta strand protein
MKKILLLLAVLLLTGITATQAQVTLSGTNYSQDFNSLSNGLPSGWTTRIGVSTTNIGTSLNFSNTSPSATLNGWSNTSAAFKNFASATGLTNTNTTAQQAASTDRALGIRPTGTFGDVATNFTSFALQLGNTAGFENFSLSMDAMLLAAEGRTNVWTLDFGIGASPTSFTTLTNWATPTSFGITTLNISSSTLAGMANLSGNVWIRFSILGLSTGASSRDSVGIDNFSLNYTAVSGSDSYWTANGSTLGGAGTWDTSGTNWSTNASLVNGAVWDSATKAIFTNSAATVTVGSVSANRGIEFATTGYVLSGGTLTLGASNSSLNTITTDAGVTAQIGSTIAGTAGLTKSGVGTLALSGTNTFSGGVNVSLGALQIATDSALGDAANDVVLNGTLRTTNSISLGSGRDISGSATLDIAGASTLTVNGAFSASATTLANSGTLDLQGSTRNVGALTINAPVIINAAGAVSLATINTSALNGTATINPDLAFTSGTKTVDVASGSLLDLNGAITGTSVVIAKTGAGTLNLDGANAAQIRIGASGSVPTAGGTVMLGNSASAGPSQIQLNSGALGAASTIVATNGFSIGGRSGALAVLGGANDMTFSGTNGFFRGTGTSGELRLDVNNKTTLSGTWSLTTGGGSATGITIGGSGVLALSGNGSLLTETITLTDTATLALDGSLGGSVVASSGTTIGGDGSIAGSLSLLAGAKFTFDLNKTLSVNGASVSFGNFGVNNLVGLDNSVASGTYKLIDGTATFNTANLNNLGAANAYDLGGGKSAYFSIGSLDVNVVPEPSTYAMLAMAGIGFAGYVVRRRRR